MNALARGIVFWLPYFLAGELLAVFWAACPWPTLTGTIRALIASYPPESVAVTLFSIALWGHFERGWSYWWLVALAVAAAGLELVKYVLR